MKGKFIVIEGPDHSGKSTLLHGLEQLLSDTATYKFTREPGGSALAEEIRAVWLSSEGDVVPSARTELFLMAASRSDHIEKTILPAMADGVTVLSSRYTDSTLAYQVTGGMPEAMVTNVIKQSTDGLVPELTILVDIDEETRLRRHSELASADYIENRGSEFHIQVREQYLALAKISPERYLVIPGTLPIEQVLAKAMSRILETVHGKG